MSDTQTCPWCHCEVKRENRGKHDSWHVALNVSIITISRANAAPAIQETSGR